MEYSCYTIYDRHTLADMSRALRKTVRKKTARRWWMAGCLLLVLGLSLLLEPGERLWFKAIILVAVVCLFVVQGWGDGPTPHDAGQRAVQQQLLWGPL